MNQYMSLTVLFVLGALLHVSCESCHPASLERDKDSEVAKITIDNQESIGYINGAPMVKIDGNITEKHIPETSKLCLLVIPKGEDVKGAIENFQAEKKELGYGNKEFPRILLQRVKGGVYYVKDLKAPEQGSLSASVFVDQLPPGAYDAYLLLHTQLYGTVFSNTKPLEIPHLDLTREPSISVVDAQPGRDVTTQATKIYVQANIQNYDASHVKQGWFLFIKKDLATDPKLAIAALLESGKKFPADPKFSLMADGKTIVHPFANPAGANNTLDANDDADPTKKIFERGATYKVYACFLGPDQTDGSPSYGVSASKEITILKPEVELSIKKLEINLIKCLDVPAPVPSVDELSIGYEAEITKQVGTLKPQIGLLFVKGNQVSREIGIQKIQSLLAAAKTDDYYQDGTDVVYLVGNDMSKIQDIVTTSSVPLGLGETYHVYFFLQDGGGEVFLSKDEVPLKVPRVNLGIKEFYTRKIAETFRVEMDQDITNEVFSDGHDRKQLMLGYGIYNPGTKDYQDAALWRLVLNNIDKIPTSKEPKKKGYSATLSSGKVFLMEMQTVRDPKSVVDAYPYDKKATNEKKYDVVLFAACENAVFYKAATDPNHQFIWYNPVKPDETVQFVDYDDGNGEKKYELLWNGPSFDHAKIQTRRADGTGVDFIFNTAPNSPLIKGILAKIIVGGPQTKIDADIQRFIDKMKKNP